MVAAPDPRWTVHHGDCLDVMRGMPDASVDAVVTDPPYGLEFMGKEWDKLDGDAWRSGGGFTKPGIGDRPTAWASYGSGDSANATCETCGGRMRGEKKCACAKPEWRVKGKPIDPGDARRSQGRSMQEWHYAWAIEALRVAKPGAHLLAFGGTRTFHRLTCAIEDAGWEIRDCLSWLYGSGFPKSHNLDGAHAGWGTALKPAFEPVVMARKPLAEGENPASMAPTLREILCEVASSAPTGTPSSDLLRTSGLLSTASSLSDTLAALSARGSRFTTATAFALTTDLRILKSSLLRITRAITTEGGSLTDGTRSLVLDAASFSRSALLKCERLTLTTAGDLAIGLLASEASDPAGVAPNAEFVCLARKPLIGTVAANVAAHGVGALNIDGCRIGTDPVVSLKGLGENARLNDDGWKGVGSRPEPTTSIGRWPANVALDEEAARLLDEQSGVSVSNDPGTTRVNDPFFGLKGDRRNAGYEGDSGGASRFFYTAKASRSEREAGLREADARSGLGGTMPTDDEGKDRDRFRVTARNTHPTVKPVDLMRWLVRLVAPMGATVLDPFLGSGTTGIAALAEGCRFVGIEREEAYVAIARARIAHAAAQGALFS